MVIITSSVIGNLYGAEETRFMLITILLFILIFWIRLEFLVNVFLKSMQLAIERDIEDGDRRKEKGSGDDNS